MPFITGNEPLQILQSIAKGGIVTEEYFKAIQEASKQNFDLKFRITEACTLIFIIIGTIVAKSAKEWRIGVAVGALALLPAAIRLAFQGKYDNIMSLPTQQMQGILNRVKSYISKQNKFKMETIRTRSTAQNFEGIKKSLIEASNNFDDKKLQFSYNTEDYDEYQNCLNLNKYLSDYLSLENKGSQFYFTWSSIQQLSKAYLYGPIYCSFDHKNIRLSKESDTWKAI